MKSLQKNLLYNIVYQIMLIALPLVTAPYISRTLGAEAVGIYSYTNSVAYYFILVAMLGIANHGNRSIAASRADKAKLDKTFSSIYTLQVFTFALAILVYIIYIAFISSDNRIIGWLQLIYVLSGLLDISWLFFGLEEFKITVTRSMLIRLATVVLMFVFVHAPSDLWKYTLIMSGGTALSQACLWLFLNGRVEYKWPGMKSVYLQIKPVLILFVPVLAYSIYKVMDKIMLGTMSSYTQVGFYNSSEKIINIPMGIITAVGTVMLPRMSNIIAQGDEKKTDDYIRLSMKMVTIVASAIAFGLMGISNVLAPVFFGEEFEPCGKIIALLSLSVFFMAWANVIRTQYLIPNHYDKIYITSTVVGALMNLLINWMLIPKFEANGAAVGTIVAELSVMLIQIISIRRIMPAYKYILEFSPVIAVGLIMMYIVNCVGNGLGKSLGSLAVQICTGGAIFCAGSILFLVVKKDEVWFACKSVVANRFKR